MPANDALEELAHKIGSRLVHTLKSGNYTEKDIDAFIDEVNASDIPQNYCECEEGSQIHKLYESLFSMVWRVGSIDEGLQPMYNLLIRVKSGLEEMRMSGVFTLEEVTAMQRQLHVIDASSKEGKIVNASGVIVEGQAIIHSLLHRCHRLATLLVIETENVDPSLKGLHEQLCEIHAGLCKAVQEARTVTLDEIGQFQVQLAGIDRQRQGGQFKGPGGTIPEGQAAVHNVLNRCFDMCRDLMVAPAAEESQVAPELRDLYKELTATRAHLEKLVANRFAVTAPEIESIQVRLDRIDSLRRDGKFMTEGRPAVPAGQAALHYLLATNYRLVQNLLITSGNVFGPEVGLERWLYRRVATIRQDLKQMRATPAFFSVTDLNTVGSRLETAVCDIQKSGELSHTTKRAIQAMLNESYSSLFELYDIVSEVGP